MRTTTLQTITHLVPKLLAMAAFLAASTSMAGPAVQGTKDAGGGILSSGTLISAKPLKVILEHSKGDLAQIMRGGQESCARKSSGPGVPAEVTSFCKAFFGGEKNFYSVLKPLKLEVHQTTPCFDKDGQPRDASIYAETKGAICISSFRLLQKTYEAEARSSVNALILHEISHLLGMNEQQAQLIQTRFRVNTSNISYDQMLYAWSRFVIVTALVGSSTIDAENVKIENFCYYVRNNPLAKILPEISTQNLSIFTRDEKLKVATGLAKLTALSDYACTEDYSVPGQIMRARTLIYDYNFKDQSQTSVGEYPTPFKDFADKDAVIHKITDLQSFFVEFNEIKSLIKPVQDRTTTDIETDFTLIQK